MKTIYSVLILLLLSNLAYSQLSQGLILNYDLNGDAIDNSGNGNHGVVNGAYLVSGAGGAGDSALHFNGMSSIDLPNNSSMKPLLPITLSIHFKIDTLGQTRPLFHSDVVANQYVGFFLNLTASGQPMAHIGGMLGGSGPNNRRSFLADNKITVGQWHHVIAIIEDYDDMRIFIDCVESPGSYSGTGSQTMIYSSDAGKMGEGASNPNYPQGFFLEGDVGHVSLWERVLLPSEIEDICNCYSANKSTPSGVDCIPTNIVSIEPFYMKVFPNPTSSIINVEFDESNLGNDLSYKLVNQLGQALKKDKVSSNKFRVNLNNLSAGLYHLLLYKDGKLVSSSKIVHQR